MIELSFNTAKREQWMKNIVSHIENADVAKDKNILLCFDGLTVQQLRPELIVSLACMIESFYRKGYKVALNRTDVGKYLFNSLRFREYWAGKKNFTVSDDNDVFNLWRITDTHKETYGQAVKDYLNIHFYKEKDLSAVQNSITEACYNVLDHAQAEGNGFSFIRYNQQSHQLQVAVCDFGIGIAQSMRNAFPDIKTDKEALAKSIEANVTVGSKPYNGGMGLDNIRCSCTEDEYFTIISNGAFLMSNNNNVRTANLDFYFKGTLICFGINISDYQDKGEIESFSFDFL